MKDDLIKAIEKCDEQILRIKKGGDDLPSYNKGRLKSYEEMKEYLLSLQSQPPKEDEDNEWIKRLETMPTVEEFDKKIKRADQLEPLYNKQIKTRQVLGQMYNDWLVFNNRKDGNYSSTVFDFFEAIGYFGEPLYNVVDEQIEEIIRSYFHGFSDAQWLEKRNSFPYYTIPSIVKAALKIQSSPNIKSEQEIENDAIQYANSRCLPKTDEWFNRIDGFKAGAEWQFLQSKIEE